MNKCKPYYINGKKLRTFNMIKERDEIIYVSIASFKMASCVE